VGRKPRDFEVGQGSRGDRRKFGGKLPGTKGYERAVGAAMLIINNKRGKRKRKTMKKKWVSKKGTGTGPELLFLESRGKKNRFRSRCRRGAGGLSQKNEEEAEVRTHLLGCRD